MGNKLKIIGAIAVIIILAAAAATVLTNSSNDSEKDSVEKIPTVITDMMGRNVTVNLPVERIVYNFESINVLAMVAGPELFDITVGIVGDMEKFSKPTYDAYAKEYPQFKDTKTLGTPYEGTFSMENILNLGPDVFILPSYVSTYGYITATDLGLLDKAGIPYVFVGFYNDSFDDGVYENNMTVLGKLFGKEDRAREITEQFNMEIDKVYSKLPTISEKDRPTVYLEIMDGSEGYGMTAIRGEPEINYAQGHNIARDNSGIVSTLYGVIDKEFLITKDPDVIFFAVSTYYDVSLQSMFGFGTSPTEGELKAMAGKYLSRDGWSSLSAVKNNRVYFIDANFRNSAECFVSLQTMAQWLYPDLFQDLDPIKELTDFYDRFLPIDSKGNWVYNP
jgi:iron complex transport system substrate-binding protein